MPNNIRILHGFLFYKIRNYKYKVKHILIKNKKNVNLGWTHIDKTPRVCHKFIEAANFNTS